MSSDFYSLTILSYGASDRGQAREVNEDALWYDVQKKIFAIADGLGGLPDGEVASRTAVEAVEHVVAYQEDIKLEDIINQANEEVHRLNIFTNPLSLGMATTLTIGHIVDRKLKIVHVGDTGIYLFRKSVLRKLTIDDTMEVDFLNQIPEKKPVNMPPYFKNALTRCIGFLKKLDFSTYEEILQPEDRILFYSDGLTKVINDDLLAQFMQEAHDPVHLVQDLIQEVNNRGAPDNITLIALFVE